MCSVRIASVGSGCRPGTRADLSWLALRWVRQRASKRAAGLISSLGRSEWAASDDGQRVEDERERPRQPCCPSLLNALSQTLLPLFSRDFYH